MKYLITGGSGLIGKRITQEMLLKNNRVNWLSSSHKQQNGVESFHWDIKANKINTDCFNGVDAIIHLAGAGVTDHNWTPAYKKEMIDSRILSTRLLFNSLKDLPQKPKVIVSASAIGIYGNITEDLTLENAPAGDIFLAKLTQQWEEEVDRFEQLGIRVVKLRIGIVLAAEGGFLKKVAAPAKWGLGAALGNGKMITSWIHANDLVNMFLFAAHHENINGAYNAVATHPVSNYEITKQIAKALHKPFFMPNVPAFALRLVFGEMASIILSSQNISSQKITNAGFTFQFNEIEPAINHLLASK
ncbi:MAG: TIGR01777 family oxidoreductase [Bacteroidota bacterium]